MINVQLALSLFSNRPCLPVDQERERKREREQDHDVVDIEDDDDDPHHLAFGLFVCFSDYTRT